MPRLTYLLHLPRFLQVELKKVDIAVRRCVRIAYYLPVRTCTAFSHSLCGSEGLSLVTQAYKMLTAPDGRVVGYRCSLSAGSFGKASERNDISTLTALLSDWGKTVRSNHALYAYSNNWVTKTRAFNIAERRFAMKSRLNLLPLKKVRSRFNNYPQPNLWCCRCGHTEETLPHVLNHCKPVMEQI